MTYFTTKYPMPLYCHSYNDFLKNDVLKEVVEQVVPFERFSIAIVLGPKQLSVVNFIKRLGALG